MVPIARAYVGPVQLPLPRIRWTLIRVGYLLLFIASAIHLTNMRITPLIYFKF